MGLEPARFVDSKISVSAKNVSVYSTAYDRGARDTVAKNKAKVERNILLAAQDGHAVGFAKGQRSAKTKIVRVPVERIVKVPVAVPATGGSQPVANNASPLQCSKSANCGGLQISQSQGNKCSCSSGGFATNGTYRGFQI